MNLVIAECLPSGEISPASCEAVEAARRIGGGVAVVLAGADVVPALQSWAGIDVDERIALEHERLACYTADAHVAALAHLIADRGPAWVVAPHTYQARDYMPALAARLGCGLATDCVGVRHEDGRVVLTRRLFGGKLNADVVVDGPPPACVTVQLGAFGRSDARSNSPAGGIRRVAAALATGGVRQRPESPVREDRGTVDLTRADRIVAIGRGLNGREHLPEIEALAAAFGAELAASRPVCDAGWLPLDRQVGSSGQTVAPRLYVALGISGAIQHVIGMRGARTVVAINKDPEAPIFESADFGIVGDLADVVPALTRALRG